MIGHIIYICICVYTYICIPHEFHVTNVAPQTSFFGLATFPPSSHNNIKYIVCITVASPTIFSVMTILHLSCHMCIIGKIWDVVGAFMGLNFRHLPTWECLVPHTFTKTNNSFKGGGFHTNYFWVILITN